MKNRGIIYRIGTLVLIGCAVTFSCKKDKQEQLTNANGTVSFSINISNLKSALNLKAAKLNSLNDVKNIVLTIQNSDGSATAYSSSKINILQMNGIFYSQKIALKVGSYKLTEFELLDASGNTIFAAPLTGSLQTQNVANPLPVAFDVLRDEVTPVYVEVLSTENLTPEDFGLARFVFNEVKTFSFLIAVTDSKKDEILSAKLDVSSGSYNYLQELENIANNVVTVKDSLNEYTLTVTKPNYKSYNHTFTYDELKAYEVKEGNLPLVIELDELSIPMDGLVAYYPFNGNANDESGNGNNGTVYGASLTIDRNGKENSAYVFNGINNYIYVPNSEILQITGQITMSAWFKTSYAMPFAGIICKAEPVEPRHGYLMDINDYEKARADVINDHSKSIGVALTSTNIVTDNQWHHMLAVYDGTIFKLYIDGQLNSQKQYSDGININNEPLLIGWDQNTWLSTRHFNGVIDDIRIYNRALSETEINLLNNSE